MSYRIFPATSGPGSSLSFGPGIILGALFEVTSPGMVLQGYYFWRADVGQAATGTFALWQATGTGTGTLVANTTQAISGMATGQWNFVALATPVALTVNTPYKVQIGIVGNFPETKPSFGSGNTYAAGITNGPLFAFSAAGGSAPDSFGDVQGSFSTGSSDPTTGYVTSDDSSANFWVDVQVDFTAVPPPSAPALYAPGWHPGTGLPGLPGGVPFAAWPPWDQVPGPAGASAVSPAAGAATGTGTAQAAVAALGANAAAATGTGAAQAPVAALGVHAGDPAGTGTAQPPVAAVGVNAGLATGTGTAQQPTVSTVPVTNAPAGAATGTGTADSPLAAIGVNAGAATGTGTAQQASVTTSGSVNANAGLATGTGTAQAPVAALGVNAAAATGTGTAQAATGQVSRVALAGLASATGTAQAPSLTLAALANAAAATALGAALAATGHGQAPFTVGTLTSGQVTPTSALTAGTGP